MKNSHVPRPTSRQLADALQEIGELAARLGPLEREVRSRRGDMADGYPRGSGIASRSPGAGGHGDPTGSLAASRADDGHRDEVTIVHNRMARCILSAFGELARAYLEVRRALGQPL